MSTAASQGELWGAAPHGWATIQEALHSPLFEEMFDRAHVGRGTALLDAGCGSGSASLLAARRGADVSGIDAAPQLIAYATQRVPDGDFQIGDIEHLPYEDESFDAVIAANSVQYSGDRVATLRELARVCRRDGRVVVSLWGPPDRVAFASVFSAVRDVLPEPPPGKGPFELSGPGVLESLAEEAGLEIEQTGEVNCPFVYEDYDQYWTANSSAGPLQAALRVVGESELKAALRRPLVDHTQPDGSIEIGPNYFKYVVALP